MSFYLIYLGISMKRNKTPLKSSEYDYFKKYWLFFLIVGITQLIFIVFLGKY